MFCRIASNHTTVNAHLFRINISSTPFCDPCNTCTDIGHVLFYCSQISSSRCNLLISSCQGRKYIRNALDIAFENHDKRVPRAVANFFLKNVILEFKNGPRFCVGDEVRRLRAGGLSYAPWDTLSI